MGHVATTPDRSRRVFLKDTEKEESTSTCLGREGTRKKKKDKGVLRRLVQSANTNRSSNK